MYQYDELLSLLSNIIDDRSRALVGILSKRVEVLEKENALTPSLYKALSKELVYENSRVIKDLIRLSLIPNVKFVVKNNQK